MQSNQLRQPSMIGAPVCRAMVATVANPAGSVCALRGEVGRYLLLIA